MLLSDIILCLQNRYHRSSGMLLISMPFGQYASHANKASIASWKPMCSEGGDGGWQQLEQGHQKINRCVPKEEMVVGNS